MRFHARIGILPHEGQLAQPLEVDLTVRLARVPSAPRAVLDYRALYDLVASAVGAAPLAYLEDVAETIAAGTLGVDGVASVRVAVRKPHVALPGPLDHAEIVIEREAAGA
jgi:dihydroneopterin aldolase